MVRRLLLVLVAFCLVAAIGSSMATTALAAHGDPPEDHSAQPCIVQDDCAGGNVLASAALLPVFLLAVRTLTPVARLEAQPVRDRSVLLVLGLDRPPQLSS